MQFNYNGKQYDIRLKSRYLPVGIKNVGSMDLLVFLSSRTDPQIKERILQSYLPTATLVKES